MKTTTLTADRLRELLNYDPETGIFTRRAHRKGYHVGTKSGCLNEAGRVLIRVDGILYKAHRLAWLYVNGEWPKNQIDHINNTPSDNRICNPREATDKQNKENIHSPRSDNKCRMRGVCLHKKSGKFVAQIHKDGKNNYLGLFDTADEARIAYLSAKAIHQPFGEISK